MAIGATTAADTTAGATALATSSLLNIIGGAANSVCSNAYASNEPEPHGRLPTLVASKPAMWVNYADPRPKGDDADAGAAPSYIPQISVDNVSLMPAVSFRLFSVNSTIGPADISPILTYSPPVLSKTVSLNPPYSTSYNIAFSPGSFGNCWSDNLTPCVERACSRQKMGFTETFKRTLSVSGPTPSASFKAADLGIADTLNFNCSWTAQPLTKATVHNSNNTIEYWGSGLKIDEANADTDQWYEQNGEVTSFTKWIWPKYIYDRNINQLEFSYSSKITDSITSVTPSWAAYPYNRSTKRVPVSILNLATDDQLTMDYIKEVQDCRHIYYVLDNEKTNYYDNTTFAITNITHSRNNQDLRSAEINYTQKSSFAPDSAYSYTMNLISSVTLPNGDIISFEYTTKSVGEIRLQLLTKIISPVSTNVIEYDQFSFVEYQNTGTYKYEPRQVTVITDSGLTTNTYYRDSWCFNPTGSSWVDMKTTSSAATENIKRYSLKYLPLNMQWYGCETENSLDGKKQYSYTLDINDRFLYASVSRYPLGGDTANDTSTFAYDSQDNLTNAIDAYGNQTEYFYAANKLDQTCVIDPRGIITSNIFDNYGNLLKTIEDYGGINRTSLNAYNTVGQVIKSTDPLNRITRNYYSTSRTPAGWEYYKNNDTLAASNGYLVATKDPLSRVTTFTYDKLGRKTIVNAPGNSTSARYATTNYYDIMDRTTATYYPDDTYVSNYYNAAGFPTRVCDRMGRWTQNTYDDAGHLARVDYPNGDWVKKLYKGNLVSMLIDGAANTTEYFYCHEQLTGVKFPDGSTRAAGFDNLNRQIWAVDERGVAVTNAYDKLGRVIASYYVPYDGNNMPTARTVTPLPSGLTIPTCDTSIIHGGFNNQIITYAYDKVGNVLEMNDWAVEITNAYDALNRKITKYTENNTYGVYLNHSIYSEYDLLNNRTKMRLIAPNDGLTNSYTYDNLNRLSSLECESLETVSATFAYNQNGKVSGITNSEASINRHFTYDNEQRLSGITADYSGSDRLSLSYIYNNAQQITEIEEGLYGEMLYIPFDNGLKSYSFTYDNRDQLTSETCENVPTSYAYDLAQNRTSKTHNYNTPETYSYVIANKLTNRTSIGIATINHSTYIYDTAGNLITNVKNGTINEFFYNAQNKLVKIELNNNDYYEFTYDSQNRRISIAKNGTSHYMIHDGNIPIAVKTFGEFEKVFVRGIGIAEGTGDVIAEIDSYGNAHYYLPNHRGDTLMVLNNGGYVDTAIRYDAFGNETVKTAPFSPTYTFSTKEYLSDIESYLYAYRIYESPSGRWTQRDPIDYQDSVNLYQFCGNNPVNSVDALGLFRFGRTDLSALPKYSRNFTKILSPIVLRPILDIINLSLAHEHGFFEDGSHQNVGFFGPVEKNGKKVYQGVLLKKNTDKSSEKPSDYSISSWQYDDKTMRQAMQNVNKSGDFDPKAYKLIGKGKNNCQNYATALRKEYKRLGGKKKYRPFKKQSKF